MSMAPTLTVKGQSAIGGITSPFVGDLLEHWALHLPDSPALTYVDYSTETDGVTFTLSWSEIEQWTRALATQLMETVEAGERVALLLPQGIEFAVAFLACLRTSSVAVPLFSPDIIGHGDRIERVVADCAPAVVLTINAKLDIVADALGGNGSAGAIPTISVDRPSATALAARAERYRRPATLPDDVAYLQYTSGSTRAPAGVELSHANLHANCSQIASGHRLRPGTATTVSWLPLFHDMGLLLGVAGPVMTGTHGIIFDPLAFIMRPHRWLELMSGRKDLITVGPNFAFDYVVRRMPEAERDGLDLSGIVSISNGAEPVLPATMARFAEAFVPHGLRPDAMKPTYGLAEATVFVAVKPSDGQPPRVIDIDPEALSADRIEPGRAGAGVAQLVSCGRPWGQDVAIVDIATSTPLGDRRVGEIWVHGPNVGRGYWQRPEETEAVFRGVLQDAGELPVSPWLKTGDLGAFVDGELYVTGRLKDLIIVDGRNIYPHDVEGTVEASHDAVAFRRLAAFAVPTPQGEAVVVVAERSRRAEGAADDLVEIGRATRAAVSAAHGLRLHDFVLVEPDTIARTSSGKIARRQSRDSYLSGTLVAVGQKAG
jgi:fatty acid CoA ligase FadD32